MYIVVNELGSKTLGNKKINMQEITKTFVLKN